MVRRGDSTGKPWCPGKCWAEQDGRNALSLLVLFPSSWSCFSNYFPCLITFFPKTFYSKKKNFFIQVLKIYEVLRGWFYISSAYSLHTAPGTAAAFCLSCAWVLL